MCIPILFTSCASTDVSAAGSPTPTPQINFWQQACEDYELRETKDYLKVYDQIISDYCKGAEPENFELNIEASETVDPEALSFHKDSELFFLSYWSPLMGDVPQKQEFVFTNKDQKWWEEKQLQSLFNPDLSWFTSKSEGGHCRVDPFIYCSKLFEPSLTKSGSPVDFRIIGTSYRQEFWQKTNIAHETVHLYQDSLGMTHWTPWYVEGQATLFELAAGELLLGNDQLRLEYINRVARHDRAPFSFENSDSVYQHFLTCGQSQQGECEQFFYAAASMFHEKLILDHGLDTYFLWQQKLANQMPKGNPGTFTQDQTQVMFETFKELFESTFTYSLQDFESTIAPSYVSEKFLEAPKNVQ